MATTSIPSTRQSDVGVQTFKDALFIRSDIAKLYFGDGGKTWAEYLTAQAATLIGGAGDLAMSDTTVFYLGDDKDMGVAWNGSLGVLSGTWSLSGVDVQLSDTQNLNFGNAADASAKWTGSDLRITSTSDLRFDVTNNYILKGGNTAGVSARQTVSDAVYLKSDAAGGGFYLMVSSG